MTLFWPILDPSLSPMCHLVKIAWTSPPPPPTPGVTWQFSFHRKHSSLLIYFCCEIFSSKIDEKRHVTIWLTPGAPGPPPPVSFGDSRPPPLRVSRIIWMVPFHFQAGSSNCGWFEHDARLFLLPGLHL